jgi:hypothetical protein
MEVAIIQLLLHMTTLTIALIIIIIVGDHISQMRPTHMYIVGIHINQIQTEDIEVVTMDEAAMGAVESTVKVGADINDK